MKENPVLSTTLKSHTGTFFSICQRPIMPSSKEWEALQTGIESIAACSFSYVKFLDKNKNAKMKDNYERTVTCTKY